MAQGVLVLQASLAVHGRAHKGVGMVHDAYGKGELLLLVYQSQVVAQMSVHVTNKYIEDEDARHFLPVLNIFPGQTNGLQVFKPGIKQGAEQPLSSQVYYLSRLSMDGGEAGQRGAQGLDKLKGGLALGDESGGLAD